MLDTAEPPPPRPVKYMCQAVLLRILQHAVVCIVVVVACLGIPRSVTITITHNTLWLWSTRRWEEAQSGLRGCTVHRMAVTHNTGEEMQ